MNTNIPQNILDNARKYFATTDVNIAVKFIRTSRAILSFVKGDTETYFIASGIIKDDRTCEAKVVYKKRLENEPEGPVSSNCDCNVWNSKDHCAHVASLYISFMLKNFKDNKTDADIAMPTMHNFAAFPDEYGTIITGPNKLNINSSHPSYSSFQYTLVSKKVIGFPIPNSFEGKLVVNMHSVENSSIKKFHFSHIDEAGVETKEISIFEHVYLFNWKKGSVSHLNNDVKEFVQKVRLYSYTLKYEDFLGFSQNENYRKYIEFRINGKEVNEYKKVHALPKLVITTAEQKGHLKVTLNFTDDNELLCLPPLVLQDLCFQNGLLSSFKKKKDAYTFFDYFIKSVTGDSNNEFKKIASLSNKRNELLALCESILVSNDFESYEHENQAISYVNKEFVIKFLELGNALFGEHFLRFSFFDSELKAVNFQIPSGIFFTGLNELNQRLQMYGLTIFYDRQEIAKWNSRIRFERRSHNTKWFDLELNLEETDLDLIQNADLETGLAFTKNGLVILNNQQKDLIRFMKKYTQHESTETLTELDDKIKKYKFILPFKKARIFELFELKRMGIEGALTDDEVKLCQNLATLESVPTYPLPEHLEKIMRPYQKTGYNWLKFLYEHKLGACLADDMGLGKTLQTISFVHSIIETIDRVLIVCPISILLNWENEFKNFSNLEVFIYHGGNREFPMDKKIIITSYGVMKKEAEITFKDKHFDILILDEVQHLKNVRSLGAYSARMINAEFRICLTGTPVENDLSEFYNILDLCVPGIWGDLQFVRTASTSKTRLIARKTAAPFILRRTKTQVLHDLPAKIENNVILNLGEDEQTAYRNNLLKIKAQIDGAQSKFKYGEILKGLLSLRQSCLWYSGKDGTQKFDHFKDITSTKIEFLIETLEQIIEGGHQALVFSQFTTYLDIIEYFLKEKHWKLSRIDGSQSINKRQKAVEDFQAHKSQVFLISLKAGGVGLNLTAASYVFIMDPWWNPAVEQQAIDRAHRIGQKNTLTVYRPIIKNSVEEKVVKLQEIKKELFKDLLPDDSEENFSGRLSMKDFEMLLS